MFYKQMIRAGLAAALAVVVALSAAACGASADASVAGDPVAAVATTAASSETAALEPVAEDAAAVEVASVVTVAADAIPLTPDEIETLYLMREEEKLARDVYLAMFDLWGLSTFENIASSEARHMEAVLGVLEDYGLGDPVGDDAPGIFSDPELNALYGELVERGSGSLVEALTVGALIEDLDIRDLEEGLAGTDQADITRVYSNLMRGSQNHLRTFTARLAAEGAEYVPVYHSEEEIVALLAATTSGSAAGNGHGRQGRSG